MQLGVDNRKSHTKALPGRLRGGEQMTALQLEATVERRTRPLQVANTELLRVIEKTEEATRQKSAFLANMSHELRTPLSSIIGFTELLQSGTFGPLNEKQTHFLENILMSSQHLLALINDLLDLSKIEAGKLVIQPESFPLREALQATVGTLRPQADQKHQSIEVVMEDGVSLITADSTRFKQILYNLLSNAIKFTPEGGKITITSRVVPCAVPGTEHTVPGGVSRRKIIEIAVADAGIGIKAEDLLRLFQRFTQLEAPIVKRYQGTGLGLALTKCLVELHGGSIRAHSDGEGRGTTFTVRLPQG
jgi:signal transduction histidine kinase